MSRERSRIRERNGRKDRSMERDKDPERDRSLERDGNPKRKEEVMMVDEEPPRSNADLIRELSRIASEVRTRALETTEPEKTKAIIRSVEVLRVADDRRTPLRDNSPASRDSSNGRKRSRQRDEDEEEEVELGHNDGSRETAPPTSSKQSRRKRKKDGSYETRGRKAKDPSHEGEFTAERLVEKRKSRENKKLEEAAKAIRDSMVKATTAKAERVERYSLIMDEMREAPTATVTQMGIQAVEVIKKIAATSKNMKGAYVGELWRAAEVLTAHMTLTAKAQAARNEMGEEMKEEIDRMRREIADMRNQEALLHGQVRDLRETLKRREGEPRLAPPPPPPPTPNKMDTSPAPEKKARKGKVYAHPSLSEEEGDIERMERELSPASKEIGRRAREEVERERREGRLPPIHRPLLQGRSTQLGEDGVPLALGAKVLPSSPLRPVGNQGIMGPLPVDLARTI